MIKLYRNDSRVAPNLRTLSVLMPIYNERWTLREIVRRVLESPVPMEIELLAVDDRSSDGSWEMLQDLARCDSRIRPIRHEQNRGKGAAIRTAIKHMTGDVAVIQDADLEYDPCEFPKLLQPILDGQADAVFGSRYSGHTRRVLSFWHSSVNRFLTTLSNVLNDLTLTDMETCYKMVRADILKQLRLTSNSFTLEPEITSRLAQWGARIYEVPISYHGRTYEEGKKIGPMDGLRAIWAIFRSRFFDTRFTHHSGHYRLRSRPETRRYNRWLLNQVKDYLGHRTLEYGSGIGNMSCRLLDRERLVLLDEERPNVDQLQRSFGSRANVRIELASLTAPDLADRFSGERIDTVFCSAVPPSLESDVDVFPQIQQILVPGGHCIVILPARFPVDATADHAQGKARRRDGDRLLERMRAAGMKVVFCKRFARLLGRALPLPGSSMIVVGRKPAAEPQTAMDRGPTPVTQMAASDDGRSQPAGRAA